MCRLMQNTNLNEKTSHNNRLFDFLTICGIGRYDEEGAYKSSQQTPGKEKQSLPKSRATEKMEEKGVVE